jgi:GNAT superfamily N-acetyltransferase
MELHELDGVSAEQWAELGAEQPGVWGGGPSEAFQWREKDRHIAALDPQGRILAVAEAALIEILIAESEPLEVVGVGGVFVRESARGRGLMRLVVQRLLEQAAEMGPERAMLFCRSHLVPVYGSFGFLEIPDPVWADQPGGRVEVPMPAMWRPLHGRPGWPSGRVDVQGLPF